MSRVTRSRTRAQSQYLTPVNELSSQERCIRATALDIALSSLRPTTDSFDDVTTVTTRDSRRPKTHAKPTQVHASRHERVQPPQQNPGERASNASTLATCPIFVKSTLA